MALPCEDKFRALEEAKKKSDDCWFEADFVQSTTTLSGIGASIACPSTLVAADSGSAGGFFKALAACSVAATGFTVGLFNLWNKLDNCNDLDREAFKAAKEFEKCAGEHKEFLNSLLKPK